MNYVTKRSNHYYYYRRVPSSVKVYDPRPFIRLSLHTDSPSQAAKLVYARNQEIETYWNELIKTGSTHSSDKFRSTVETARILGFGYYPAAELAKMPLSEIFVRIESSARKIKAPKHVETVMGGVAKPVIRLSDCLPKYFEFSKHLIMNKTQDQIRKWENPRIKAMRNFIKTVGDKPINELTREDTLKVKDALIERVENGKIVAASANKEIILAKTIIEGVSDNYRLGLDIRHLFRKLILNKGEEVRRLPFDTNYIINTLLNENNLKGLDHEAKAVMFAFAETGASVSELVGLLPEDIILADDVPHIIIKPGIKRNLKTPYRKRAIPLVGYALEAFKAFPQGFPIYKQKPDVLSNILNKFLTDNNLLPTKQHSLYSLRHSFQDRLTKVNAPDRVQADLMGHKFNRQAYGDGSSLIQKIEWLKKTQLKHV